MEVYTHGQSKVAHSSVPFSAPQTKKTPEPLGSEREMAYKNGVISEPGHAL